MSSQILDVEHGEEVEEWNQKLYETWPASLAHHFALCLCQLKDGSNKMHVSSPVKPRINRLVPLGEFAVVFIVSFLGHHERRRKHGKMHDDMSLHQDDTLQRFF